MSDKTVDLFGEINEFIKTCFCDNEKDRMVASEAAVQNFAEIIHEKIRKHDPQLFEQLQQTYLDVAEQLSEIQAVLRHRKTTRSLELQGAPA